MKYCNFPHENYHTDSPFFHPTVIIDNGAQIGENTRIWHYTHILGGAKIGKNCMIAQNCFIAGDVGDNCRIQNNVNIFKGVILQSDVFIGPNTTFTNIKKPRAFIKHDSFELTLVKKHATIGAGVTIVCGVKIGEFAMVGAGSVVTKDVPPLSLVYGNPARIHGQVLENGNVILRTKKGD